jgi:hypothetical protein
VEWGNLEREAISILPGGETVECVSWATAWMSGLSRGYFRFFTCRDFFLRMRRAPLLTLWGKNRGSPGDHVILRRFWFVFSGNGAAAGRPDLFFSEQAFSCGKQSLLVVVRGERELLAR